MLAYGCGDLTCKFKLCRSCSSSKKVDSKTASVLAISLASKPSMLCPAIISMQKESVELKLNQKSPDINATSMQDDISSSFLPRMISFSSLSHIFSPITQSPRPIKKVSSKDDIIPDSNRIPQFSFSQNNFRSIIDVNPQQDKSLISKKTQSYYDSSFSFNSKAIDYLNHAILQQLLSEGRYPGNFQTILDTLTTIYSSRTRLGRSFLMESNVKPSKLDLEDLNCFFTTISQTVNQNVD